MNKQPGKKLNEKIEKLIKLANTDVNKLLTNENIESLFSEISALLGKEIKPRILMAGKTGVGKSSVLNSLLGKNVFETGNIPTTKANAESLWQSANGDIVVIDVPGFAEADAKTINNLSYEDNMTRLAALDAHMAVLVIKSDDRALEKESEFLKKWRTHPALHDLPLLIVVNQIDKMKPVREWDPETLNLKTPIREKEKSIREFLDYVSDLDAFNKVAMDGDLFPFSAGEIYDDPQQYGVDILREKIYSKLPDCARTVFARIANLKEREGERLIAYYSGLAASAVALNPIAGSDCLLIAPVQIAMMMHLARLHDIDLTPTAIKGILSTIVSSLAGRFAYQQIVSFIPVVKNFAGPGLAFTFTYAIGQIVNHMLKENRIEISEQELEKLAKELKLNKAEKEFNSWNQ